MKKLLYVLGSLLVVALVAGMAVAAVRYTNTASEQNDQTVTAACTRIGTVHQVTIKDNTLTPSATIHGVLCDKLTITNEDDRLRLMAFGQHDHHQAYDGTTSKVLARGQSLTVIMNKTGEYTFHDHLEDEVVGNFVVAK